MSSSPASTPPSLPASTTTLPPPPPSPLATAVTSASDPQNPDNDTPLSALPSLTTTPATIPPDKLTALRLIADSIAQQRQLASRLLIFHPLSLALFTLLLALVAQVLYTSPSDLALVGTTWAGLVMAGLVAVRWAVSGYLVLAEEVGWGWLEDGKGDGGDEVVVTRWGEEIIGVVVFRVVRDDGGGKGRRKGGKGKGVIRAWTVRLKFRGKGVGTGLLEEVVRVCRERGVEGVEFAEGHANSGRVLPKIFNGGFERREAKARKMLEEVVEAQAGSAKKR
ncbi:MAG: hypothetical protein M1830_005763 [Pleopsidium flavum]|nr:MAG: hypothetical protein M1830_005763 [Pleopsidium flavum]